MLAIRDTNASEAIFSGMERQRSADLELRQEFDRYVDDSRRLIEELQQEVAALRLQAGKRESAILTERKVSNATIASLKSQNATLSATAEQYRTAMIASNAEVARLNARIAEAKKHLIPGFHFAAYIGLCQL